MTLVIHFRHWLWCFSTVCSHLYILLNKSPIPFTVSPLFSPCLHFGPSCRPWLWEAIRPGCQGTTIGLLKKDKREDSISYKIGDLVDIINLQLSTHFSPYLLPSLCLSFSLRSTSPAEPLLSWPTRREITVIRGWLSPQRPASRMDSSLKLSVSNHLHLKAPTLRTTQTSLFSFFFSKWGWGGGGNCELLCFQTPSATVDAHVTPFSTDRSVWEASNPTSS